MPETLPAKIKLIAATERKLTRNSLELNTESKPIDFIFLYWRIVKNIDQNIAARYKLIAQNRSVTRNAASNNKAVRRLNLICPEKVLRYLLETSIPADLKTQ